MCYKLPSFQVYGHCVRCCLWKFLMYINRSWRIMDRAGSSMLSIFKWKHDDRSNIQKLYFIWYIIYYVTLFWMVPYLSDYIIMNYIYFEAYNLEAIPFRCTTCVDKLTNWIIYGVYVSSERYTISIILHYWDKTRRLG